MRRAANANVPLWALALSMTLVLSPLAAPQGRDHYMNLETPVVQGLHEATVPGIGKRVLLVINTPDSALEVYDIDQGHQFLLRIPVGLEPNSVQAVGASFYVTNYLGDSVTWGVLEWNAQTLEVEARVGGTLNVGDEPMHMGFYSAGPLVLSLVAFNDFSKLGIFDVTGGFAPLFPDVRLVQPNGNPPLALHQARVVEVRNDRVYVLGHQGGVEGTSYDLDILSANLLSQPLTFNHSFTGLGSTNWNMKFSSEGDLWVVGARARNTEAAVSADLKDMALNETGFVTSHLFRLMGPTTVTPNSPRFERDLNREPNGAIVPFEEAIAQPTDLALYEGPSGAVQKVFIAGFSSERIGVLTRPGGMISTPNIAFWNRDVIDLPTTTTGPSSHWGPRSLLMLDGPNGSEALYVLNRFDNSFSVIDPITYSIQSFPLQNDPTPQHVVAGRPLLYTANLPHGSGPSALEGGFVSCSSCHPDGGSDGLSWRLGDPAGTTGNIAPPLEFVRSILAGFSADPDPAFANAMLVLPTFDPEPPDDKSHMVTQRLQGLMNFEIAYDDPIVRDLFANAPYHWRGDKAAVTAFNEAFVNLMGANDVGTTETGPLGIESEDMELLDEFVRSIHYPPNPKEPKDRRYTQNALLGRDFFHTEAVVDANLGNRSCVQCHMLPEGSNNRIAVFTAVPAKGDIVLAPTGTQPLEAAALRGRFKMEGMLMLDPDGHHEDGTVAFDLAAPPPRTSQFGLEHTGTQSFPQDMGQPQPVGINTFIDIFSQAVPAPELTAIKQFVHEFDTGVGPIVGNTRMVRLDQGSVPVSVVDAIEEDMEQVGLVNAGLVVRLHRGSTIRSWSYFAARDFFVEEVEPGVVGGFSLDDLLALLVDDDDYLAFHYVPLGSERRLAAPDGVPGAAPAQTVANLELMPMRPITANEGIDLLRDNWVPWFAPASQIASSQPFPNLLSSVVGVGTDSFLATMRLFQYGLISSPNAGFYGFPDGLLRHEPPRRLSVKGRNFMYGCKLLLSIPYPPEGYVGPTPRQVAEDQTGTLSIPTLTLELPLHSTSRLDPDDRAEHEIWESAVELEPFVGHMLLLGGPRAPGVQDTIDSRIRWTQFSGFGFLGQDYDPYPTPPPLTEEPSTDPAFGAPTFTQVFQPDDWNWYRVQVENPGQSPVDGGWQQLRFQAP